jgi:4a-hydroxytetrahydrobiopterin dehydratase
MCWITENNALSKSFKLKSFEEAISFMANIALLADEIDHHPKMTNLFSTVTIQLTTYTAGQTITDKDHNLAKRIDQIALELFSIPS